MTKLRKFLKSNPYPVFLVIMGALGLLFSMILAYEELAVAKDPTSVPSCSVNPIINCASNFGTRAGALLIVPNSYFGIAAFAALATIGVMIAAIGQTPRKWFMRLLFGGLAGGMLMVYFFLYESLYVIGTLCPYCLAVWAVVSATFWYTTLWMVKNRHLTVPKRLSKLWLVLQKNHFGVLLMFYLLIAGLILFRFREYFQSVIG